MNIDPRFLQLGLILVALMVMAGVSLLWLLGSVRRPDRAPAETPPPSPTDGKAGAFTLSLGPKAVGVLGVLTGLAFMGWAWHETHDLGRTPTKLAFLGPFLLCLGLWSVVEGPDLRARRITPLGWGFSAAGIALGVVYILILRSVQLPH
ncbi:MAG: hypothetical protein U0835_08920 [Isosphaeraceae bacterium]